MQEDIIPKLQNQHLIKFKKYHVLLRERKNNRSIRTSSVIFLAEFNPCGPNVSKIINKHRHLWETDDKLKLFPKNSIVVANKRGRNLQELLTRADPYNIKSDLIDLNFHGYKKCGKKCNWCNNFVDEPLLLCQKQLDDMHNKKCYIFGLLHKMWGTRNGFYCLLETSPIKL